MEEHIESLDDTVVGNYDIQQVQQKAEEDFNFLAALCLPEVCQVPFPDIYLGMQNLVNTSLRKVRDFSKFALGLPRGHGKTTWLKILIVSIILFTNRRFILVVCASESFAENIIADVIDILDSPNIQAVFGNWRLNLDTDQSAKKSFTFRGRSIILAGVGSGSTLRGLNLKNHRPDVILCDDMQTQKEAESDAVSKKLLAWFVGTLMKAKNPRNCTTIYIGNMYRDVKIGGSQSTIYTCILRNLQNNPNWTSWIVGGILANGTALWEEVQPLQQLIAELQSDTLMGCADIFYAEVQNDPTCGGGAHFDISRLPQFDVDPIFDIPVGKFLIIDPSLGQKKSDAQIVGECWVINGKPYLRHLHLKQVSAPELVQWVLKYASVHRIPLVVAESVAYQGSLLQWFRHFANKEKITGIEFLPISPGGRRKNSRIISLFKGLMAGTTGLYPNVLAQVLSQISTFDPIKTNNTDDILDVTAYLEEITLKYALELRLPEGEILDGEVYDSEIVEDNCVF